jgi:hypothetical protein
VMVSAIARLWLQRNAKAVSQTLRRREICRVGIIGHFFPFSAGWSTALIALSAELPAQANPAPLASYPWDVTSNIALQPLIVLVIKGYSHPEKNLHLDVCCGR